LAARTERIDLAVVSPAVRAGSTWDLVSAELDVAPPMRIDERVYGASDLELLALIRGLPDELGTVVVVGHNPGFEDLAALLTGEMVPMPTSALAVIAVPGSWSTAAPGSAVLQLSGRPPVT
jgi:phosphohistidine phosphatase